MTEPTFEDTRLQTFAAAAMEGIAEAVTRAGESDASPCSTEPPTLPSDEELAKIPGVDLTNTDIEAGVNRTDLEAKMEQGAKNYGVEWMRDIHAQMQEKNIDLMQALTQDSHVVHEAAFELHKHPEKEAEILAAAKPYHHEQIKLLAAQLKRQDIGTVGGLLAAVKAAAPNRKSKRTFRRKKR